MCDDPEPHSNNRWVNLYKNKPIGINESRDLQAVVSGGAQNKRFLHTRALYSVIFQSNFIWYKGFVKGPNSPFVCSVNLINCKLLYLNWRAILVCFVFLIHFLSLTNSPKYDASVFVQFKYHTKLQCPWICFSYFVILTNFRQIILFMD